jgi:hypothetical protein
VLVNRSSEFLLVYVSFTATLLDLRRVSLFFSVCTSNPFGAFGRVLRLVLITLVFGAFGFPCP